MARVGKLGYDDSKRSVRTTSMTDTGAFVKQSDGRVSIVKVRHDGEKIARSTQPNVKFQFSFSHISVCKDYALDLYEKDSITPDSNPVVRESLGFSVIFYSMMTYFY